MGNHIMQITRRLGTGLNALIVGGVLITTTLAVCLAPHSVSADSMSVSPVYPMDNETVDGAVTFRASVSGMADNSYEMFWAVDNGTWNRMDQQGSTSSAAVNVTGWNWQKDNTYKLQLIALQKSNWQPVETDIQIHIGTASVAAAPAPNLPGTVSLQAASSQPFSDKTLYTDPTTAVAQQATTWAASHPSDASGMDYIANQPLATWFGDWNNNVESDANNYVSKATAAGQLPVLVTYNIPERDCGSYSAGGATSAQAYQDWISSFAAGIGKRQAIVIVEPDAIADMDCLSSADQTSRLNMLSQAVFTLKQQTDAAVYLDAGHPNWHTTSYMAQKLQAAGATEADGFSLNVSNFISTAANTAYGTAISKQLHNTHFVIDTSRNGNGAAADAEWCNPSGRALGETPTLSTGNPLVDAYLWVKAPGGSDGTCGPSYGGTTAPNSGSWWPQYALDLLHNSQL